jgi:hypothetical protein
METNSKLDVFLRDQMSVENELAPSADLVKAARLKVLARKNISSANQDIFYRIAGFLNLRTRLSYAVVVLLFAGLVSVYFVKEEDCSSSSISSPETVNIPSARSSTVLSSIITFETRH